MKSQIGKTVTGSVSDYRFSRREAVIQQALADCIVESPILRLPGANSIYVDPRVLGDKELKDQVSLVRYKVVLVPKIGKRNIPCVTSHEGSLMFNCMTIIMIVSFQAVRAIQTTADISFAVRR